ncbi:oligoribonuclease NrnB [Campylobacter sp. RM5004]|uniref:DHH family phosphoesterase n=1 Tax=Campylobacter sp. RM5004 TaxID=1660078 RepID=UPI001EFB7A4A|nr:DHH family phosphoesterase [Campylobacter sp. RM5004]ULO01094.1 oligoribonuclease NrnB [Campylobacter sp. RM5004]
MKIYHLSHTDLDGYGCQYVVANYFKNCEFYNSNYGKEIEERFDEIIQKIEANPNELALILITDVNPVDSVCEDFSNRVAKLENAKLLLLDHHQTGKACMEKYPWYLLDSSRCATKITYDFFSKIFGEDKELSLMVDIINSIDIWLSDNKHFELGKILMQIIASSKEINRVMFSKQNHAYMFFLLNKAKEFFHLNEPHIALEDATHKIKKEFFKSNKNDTLCNLISDYLVRILSENKEDYTIYYKDKKGLLVYDIGNVSVIGNDFLVKNPEYDFFLEINPGKKISLRANNKIDVSLFAKTAFNGGGHANASGGIFSSYKDSNVYSKIYEQTKTYLEKFNEK